MFHLFRLPVPLASCHTVSCPMAGMCSVGNVCECGLDGVTSKCVKNENDSGRLVFSHVLTGKKTINKSFSPWRLLGLDYSFR